MKVLSNTLIHKLFLSWSRIETQHTKNRINLTNEQQKNINKFSGQVTTEAFKNGFLDR